MTRRHDAEERVGVRSRVYVTTAQYAAILVRGRLVRFAPETRPPPQERNES